MQSEGVIASAFELVEILEATREPSGTFSDAELRYAESKSDPERRLAARLAAKRAVAHLLGSGTALAEVEVLPARGGPPSLAFSKALEARLRSRGVARTLVSLTHGRAHAAAAVLFLAPGA